MAGNIRYIEPDSRFKKVGWQILKDNGVDVISLGAFLKAISFGKNWQMNVKGLASVLGISLDRVRKAFATLEKAGYLRRSRAQDDEGRLIGWNYEFSSTPFTDLTQEPLSDNTDVGEMPPSECANIHKLPLSENGQVKYNKIIHEKEDLKSKREKIEVMENPVPTFPYPKPFSLSPDEKKLAGNVPQKIVQIKRHHLKKNLEVIEGVAAMDSDQSESFLDYWCSPNHDYPEKIRAEEDKYFNLNQKAVNWMKMEKKNVRTTSTYQQTKIEQYTEKDIKFKNLVSHVYRKDQNNTGAGNSSDNAPDEQ